MSTEANWRRRMEGAIDAELLKWPEIQALKLTLNSGQIIAPGWMHRNTYGWGSLPWPWKRWSGRAWDERQFVQVWGWTRRGCKRKLQRSGIQL